MPIFDTSALDFISGVLPDFIHLGKRERPCPRCRGKHERKVFSSGRIATYCEHCLRAIRIERREQGGRKYRNDGLCPTCKERKREIIPSTGKARAYCPQCRREGRRK